MCDSQNAILPDPIVVQSSSAKVVLQLPNELLHKIIIYSVEDALHSVGTRSACTWEMNLFVTFYCVSIPFREISKEVVCKAFDISKPHLDNEDKSHLATIQEILVSLRGMATRLRKPSNAFSLPPSPSAYSPTANLSPLFASYMLYLTSATLRENAAASTAQAYQRTHEAINATLSQSLTLCKLVSPPRVTGSLYTGILEEFELSRCGTALVRGFNELKVHVEYMRILQPSIEQDGTGPTAGVRSLIHTSLATVENAIEKYPHILLNEASFSRLNLFQLPGVLIGLRQICSLQLAEDEYRLEERIHSIRQLWLHKCPFLQSRCLH
ncbi:hypothetical protein DFP72DRAFT_531996 [Ephemerocybe angulata]|uniref:Uncharacterized protein n=1 Tax=Ephemerocybe angulata TaxID=980116 RepID=A0A8H6HNP7_9AGAR|nr:hypothetical protein DFP72DRAFT_531996 [Tulosesus angulatus]